MAQYEVTIIVDPVLSGNESKETVKTYKDMLTEKGGSIVHVEDIGLRSLAYPIKKRTSGIYSCIEFKSDGSVIDDLELALRRDDRIIRFLTVKLDKYGVEYNENKRKNHWPHRHEKVAEEVEELTEDVDTLRATGPVPAKSANSAPLPTREMPEPVPTADTIPEPKTIAEEELDLPDQLDAFKDEGPDDLTRIEGIGPKVSGILAENGITTFADLANASSNTLKGILSAQGGNYVTMDTSSWPEQAQLIFDGKEDELSTLQDRLKGGREA